MKASCIVITVAVGLALFTGCISVESTRAQLASGNPQLIQEANDNIYKKAVWQHVPIQERVSYITLTKDFDLLGFGAETHKNKAHLKAPNMCFINYNNEENKASHFNDHGMRHRSCYYFCDVIEGAVGIIFSQDGTVKACTKYNGKVYVYDHISLPLL